MHSSLTLALVLVATSALTIAGVLLLIGALRSHRPAPGSRLAAGGGDAAFLFDAQVLIDTNARGATLLDSLTRTDADAGSDWQHLTRFLARAFPGLDTALAALPQTRRTRLSPAGDQGAELVLDWLDGALRITLVDPLAEDGAVMLDRLSFRALQEELALLRMMTESAPLPLWRETAEGHVIWANGAYLQRAAGAEGIESLAWPLPGLFPPADGATPQRIALPAAGAARPAWFDVVRVADGDNTLSYALPADEAHQAEKTKRDFIQTLTKTFATLPIGLAVFDRTRRLQMFNPALTDLTGLEPEFLLSKPGIEGFLNRMRDKHVLPEPRDYRSWSRRLLDIETSGAAGDFEETWSRATGQTFRVSASPHPDGALAFLIEDITSETHMNRGVRAEMETSQSVLNQFDEAIAVFAGNGQLVLTNTAFTRLWTLDGEDSLAAITLSEAIDNWSEAGEDPALWSRIAALGRPGAEAQPVSGTMRLSDGESLGVTARRTSTGALMISFSPPERPPQTPRAPAVRALA